MEGENEKPTVKKKKNTTFENYIGHQRSLSIYLYLIVTLVEKKGNMAN